jgi:hypothetical protein
VTTVRPPIFPPQRPAPSGPQRADAAKLAAQKAFFEAALGRPAAPAAVQPAAPTAVSTPAAAPRRLPEPGAETPQKILRPGSLLDIKI